MVNRIIFIVLDSVGMGELPDAAAFGDAGANTLGHIAAATPGFALPHLQQLGLGNIGPQVGLPPVANPSGAFARAAETSPGKDTTTGHWELGGLILRQAFPVFEKGFPAEFISAYEARIGRKVIGNYAASGTAIIDELGPAHMETGCPIVYTSADSVFQIAAHEEVIPLPQLYEWCAIAREMLHGPLAVGRVIARPFIGRPGAFSRTPHRRDFSLLPPGKTLLDLVKDAGMDCVGVGKISDIYAAQGITHSYKTAHNQEGIDKTLKAMTSHGRGLIMTNLVDFDQNFGHRRDVPGYANALREFDARLSELLSALQPRDVLVITADHGNDPTAPGSDHTREYVPVLFAGACIRPGVHAGTRSTFADVGATLAALLGLPATEAGTSFHEIICQPS